jgi:hypothetical protein
MSRSVRFPVSIWFLISAATVVCAQMPRLQLGSTSTAPDCAAGTLLVWGNCDLSFDLTPQDSPQAELRAEFRSPRHRTYLLRAFKQDGRLIFRFAATEAGVWDYRLTAENLARLDGQTGKVTAGESSSHGFIRAANVHHFATENIESNGSVAPHLWMATEVEKFASVPRSDFDALIHQRALDGFTHLRVAIDSGPSLVEVAERIRAINAEGMTADIILGAVPENAKQREHYLEDVVVRLCAFNVTWAGARFPGGLSFESKPNSRAILREIGAWIQKFDPYSHPRTTLADVTSASLLNDGWMNVLSYGNSDVHVGSVEHQLFALPGLNTGIRNQKDLWNGTMNGQYPASGSGPYMKAWAEFMAQNRYWELEPYFDVDGGRAVALDGVEYIVYVERPGPIELTVESHEYDVEWINPANGEVIKQKNFKGEHFAGEPPDRMHDWVLRVSREGRKDGMLKSYKFDSRPVPVQEVEQNPTKIPYDVVSPASAEISLSKPGTFGLKAKRDTRATRSLLVEWTAEVVLEGTGYRLAGTGKEGMLNIPTSVFLNQIPKFPAVLSIRVAFLNANGKAYTLDRAFRLVP